MAFCGRAGDVALRHPRHMNSIKRIVTGLVTSLLLAVGLAGAAEGLDAASANLPFSDRAEAEQSAPGTSLPCQWL